MTITPTPVIPRDLPSRLRPPLGQWYTVITASRRELYIYLWLKWLSLYAVGYPHLEWSFSHTHTDRYRSCYYAACRMWTRRPILTRVPSGQTDRQTLSWELPSLLRWRQHCASVSVVVKVVMLVVGVVMHQDDLCSYYILPTRSDDWSTTTCVLNVDPPKAVSMWSSYVLCVLTIRIASSILNQIGNLLYQWWWFHFMTLISIALQQQ